MITVYHSVKITILPNILHKVIKSFDTQWIFGSERVNMVVHCTRSKYGTPMYKYVRYNVVPLSYLFMWVLIQHPNDYINPTPKCLLCHLIMFHYWGRSLNWFPFNRHFSSHLSLYVSVIRLTFCPCPWAALVGGGPYTQEWPASCVTWSIMTMSSCRGYWFRVVTGGWSHGHLLQRGAQTRQLSLYCNTCQTLVGLLAHVVARNSSLVGMASVYCSIYDLLFPDWICDGKYC